MVEETKEGAAVEETGEVTITWWVLSHNGSLYGVPFRHDGSGVYYNKTVFKDADLDPESDCDYAPTNCYIISCI